MTDKDIIINGVSINALKEQRALIKEGAAKIISDNIDLATSLTKKLVLSTDKEEIEKLAKEAYEALDVASLLSGVSGVSFFLPFYEEYSGNDDDEIMSHLIENSENEVLEELDESVNKLCSMFYQMESQSSDWHSSRC